eukprot:COSAG01_NODE_3161_length_6481_cov_89.230962_4_plen_113_part_00
MQAASKRKRPAPARDLSTHEEISVNAKGHPVGALVVVRGGYVRKPHDPHHRAPRPPLAPSASAECTALPARQGACWQLGEGVVTGEEATAACSPLPPRPLRARHTPTSLLAT